MGYGFRKLPTDIEFARRSAKYLTSLGYGPAEVGIALVSELNVEPETASALMSEMDRSETLV